MPRLRFSCHARLDLQEIARFVARDKPRVARELVAKIRAKCVLLTRHLKLGEHPDEVGQCIRSRLVGNYVIYYREVAGHLEVSRVIRGERDIRSLWTLPLRLDDAPIKDALAQFLCINWRPMDREHEYPKLVEACRRSAKPKTVTRESEGSSRLEAYFEPGVDPNSRLLFLRYVHDHLLQHGLNVVRLRHYCCGNKRCKDFEKPFKDREAIDEALAPDGEGKVFCGKCGKPILLRDVIEENFVRGDSAPLVARGAG